MSTVKVTTTLPTSWKEFEVGEWCQTFLSEKIVACIQFERVRSMFSWNESIHSEEEWRITLTSTIDSVTKLVNLVEENHPYDVPQITWHAVNTGKLYGDWVKEEIE